MTDRELLELAARAAEVDYALSGGQLWTTMNGSINKYTERWNPLANDGQALRLAVKLFISVWVDSSDACCSWCPLGQNPFSEGMQQLAQEIANDDPYAATRRAIVRAAAEIGKQMKEKA